MPLIVSRLHFLVLDRNGNGTIDSGAELFGDSTVLADGSTAADGFAALVAQDTNGDGVVDANDSGWGELKIWRDLNQNGISEAGELQSLDDSGIASLDVGAQSHSQVLADGNRLADLGRFTWVTGEAGEIVLSGEDRAELDQLSGQENNVRHRWRALFINLDNEQIRHWPPSANYLMDSQAAA